MTPSGGSRSWTVDDIVHFGAGDFVRSGHVHFGFHDREGRRYGVEHQRHLVACLTATADVAWTLAREPVFDGVPNITAELENPMFVDSFPDGTLVVSNWGNARLFHIDAVQRRATLLVDGRELGIAEMGNCVVDRDGHVWVNEVKGCRLWCFDRSGRVVETVGDGTPGFQRGRAAFADARFDWVYDIRPGPDGTIYVLDSRNFSVRVVDPDSRTVVTIAGTGEPGYGGDGGDPRQATFGSDPAAAFDGPYSLAVDESGTAYVGDRYNRVVRMIDRKRCLISTIAGRGDADPAVRNDAATRDPLVLNLPEISSMDYSAGRLFVPTDLTDGAGDLAVLRAV